MRGATTRRGPTRNRRSETTRRPLGGARILVDIAIVIIIIETTCYRYRLRPRMLRDVSNVDMRTRILGQEVAFPVCVAATAMQRMAHEDGELATARGEG